MAISDEYKASLNKWIGGGPEPLAPKTISDAFANCGALLVLRNQELFPSNRLNLRQARRRLQRDVHGRHAAVHGLDGVAYVELPEEEGELRL